MLNVHGTLELNVHCMLASVCPCICLPVISANLLVQLSIFLIGLFVGTYRLSSHDRLEAFVIQT